MTGKWAESERLGRYLHNFLHCLVAAAAAVFFIFHSLFFVLPKTYFVFSQQHTPKPKSSSLVSRYLLS